MKFVPKPFPKMLATGAILAFMAFGAGKLNAQDPALKAPVPSKAVVPDFDRSGKYLMDSAKADSLLPLDKAAQDARSRIAYWLLDRKVFSTDINNPFPHPPYHFVDAVDACLGKPAIRPLFRAYPQLFLSIVQRSPFDPVYGTSRAMECFQLLSQPLVASRLRADPASFLEFVETVPGVELPDLLQVLNDSAFAGFADIKEAAIAYYDGLIAGGAKYHYPAYYDRAVIYQLSKRYSEAIADYSKVIEIKPDYTEAYLGRSGCYYAVQDTERAEQDAQKVRELWQEAYDKSGPHIYGSPRPKPHKPHKLHTPKK